VISATPKDSKSIIIKWSAEEDDITYYNVYKSANSPVTKLDYFTKTNQNSARDVLIEPGKIYYYRVSAIDKAGNEGELSTEVSAILEKRGDSTDDNLDANMQEIKVDPRQILQIEQKNLIFDSALDNLTSIQNSYDEFAKIAGIDAEIENIRKSIQETKSQLNNLKNVQLSEDIMVGEINKADMKLRSLMKRLPLKAELITESKFKNSPTTIDIETGLMGLLNILRLDETIDGISKYKAQAKKLQSKYAIETIVKKIQTIYSDGTRVEMLQISKEITGEKKDGMSIIEIIPKEIAESATDIEFDCQNEIIEQDPIIRIPINEKIVYKVKTGNIDGGARIVSVVSDDPNDYTQFTETNDITGNFIQDAVKKESIYYLIGLIVIIGMLGYYFMMPGSRSGEVAQMKLLVEKCHISLNHGNIEEAEENYGKLAELYKKANPKHKTMIFNDSKLIYMNLNELRVKPNKPFVLCDGTIINNLSHLGYIIDKVDDETFRIHVNDEKNDLSAWLDSIGKKELSELVAKQKSKQDIKRIVLNHILSENMQR
jgi:hypothetical protein